MQNNIEKVPKVYLMKYFTTSNNQILECLFSEHKQKLMIGFLRFVGIETKDTRK